MIIGYARVSKQDGTQSLDMQIDALLAQGVQEQYIYKDYVSGKREDRPQLQACLKALQPGNTLLVWKLDRLGRDLKHLISIIDDLNKREVHFKVLTGMGAHMDTTSPHGRMVFNMFGALAEYERELIVERTRAGLAAARARGRMGGRPRIMDAEMLKLIAHAMSDKTTVATDLAGKFRISTATLYTYVNGDGTLKKMGEHLLSKKKG